MKLTNSLLGDLVTEYNHLRSQIYFKSSLTALARAMQDLALADHQPCLVIANFQQEKFFRQQEHRFQRLASKGDHVYILGIPDIESGFAVASSGYETIPIKSTDTLAGERYLVVIGHHYSAFLAVREKLSLTELKNVTSAVDQGERFEGVWSFEREVAYTAADWLLGRIANYRPELKAKTQQARKLFVTKRKHHHRSLVSNQPLDLNIFTQRLVTYLQTGQYKLLKAYKAIATAERKESLSNRIAAAQRSSLNPQSILHTTVKELGQLFPHCRCLLYQINSEDTEVQIEYESKPLSMTSLIGQSWSIADNPLFIVAQAQKSTLVIEDVSNNVYLSENSIVQEQVARAGIQSWIMVSLRYQGQLLGMLELHHGGSGYFPGKPEDLALMEAVAISAGAALTQASAYTNLRDLNAQLEAVERIQNNLIAIVGHELRTPLSTIQICLESLATEPDMPSEFKDTMLDTALGDTERLGQLIQNFLTLSKLEAGKTYHNSCHREVLTIDYALNLALGNIQKTSQIKNLPKIHVKLPEPLPTILADIDGLVEVLTKLIDNACKFTPTDGEIIITAQIQATKETTVTLDSHQMLEIIIADTGRGMDESELEIIFDRFSQSESYLRRTVSGAGLGLAICRKIIRAMGGEIWAKSGGKNQGSHFHFTLPLESQYLR